VGLYGTAAVFTVVLAVAWFFQFRTDRYRASVYWPAVVVVSVAGTLYTDILTDVTGVALWLSTTVFAAVLAVVFAIWWAREGTLSIHSITTPAREAFYWLAVLVTFALGTAAGDWTLELTGWSPGRSVLLPAALIAIVIIGWRLGAGPVLSFWLAYILTRPLGANMGDWFALPKDQGGLNIGTFGTSLIFLGAIAATVAYLARTKADVTEQTTRRPVAAPTRRPRAAQRLHPPGQRHPRRVRVGPPCRSGDLTLDDHRRRGRRVAADRRSGRHHVHGRGARAVPHDHPGHCEEAQRR